MITKKTFQFLNYIGNKIKADEVPWAQYLITKQLSKHPNQYPDQKTQPHVQVALRLIKSGVPESNLINHIIPYLILKNDKVNTQ